MDHPRDGRELEPICLAGLRTTEDGRLELLSPRVGLYRASPRPGTVVVPGDELGELEVLGVLHRLIAPAGARGRVDPIHASPLARRPVGFGDVLAALDPRATPAMADDVSAEADSERAALVLRATMSGRFYGRPAPDRPPYVAAGDVVTRGQTIGLLEVMKTFNRLIYGPQPPAQLPERARVVAVLPAEESELEVGDVILELEPVTAES